MPTILLDVPLEAQEKANCCWHTSAYMICLYWQRNGKGAGPMNTVASSYAVADAKGISPAQFITVAQQVGLYKLPVKSQHTGTDLFNYLKAGGPVWCADFWFGVGHIIVPVGTGSSLTNGHGHYGRVGMNLPKVRASLMLRANSPNHSKVRRVETKCIQDREPGA